MRSLARAIPGLIPATLVLFGCSASPGSGARPDRAPAPAPSAADGSCYIADASAATADTLYAIGVPSGPPGAASAMSPADCEQPRRERGGSPPIVLSLSPGPGTDLRDLLDVGLASAGGRRPDVLVTRDAGVIAYSERRRDYSSTPLPWSSTYVLLPVGPSSAAVASAAEREALARDAVTEEARGASGPFAWRAEPACGAMLKPSSAAPRPVVAYVAGDVIARQLAERLVALANGSSRPAWLAAALATPGTSTTVRIAPVAADSIGDALASGHAAAAVLPIARDPRTPCGTRDNAAVPSVAIPLVDARAHLLIRHGSGAAVLVAPDGTLRFVSRGAR